MKYRDLANRDPGESSREIKERVNRARKIQLTRFKAMKIYNNAQMTNRHIKKHCQIDDASQRLLKLAIVAAMVSGNGNTVFSLLPP